MQIGDIPAFLFYAFIQLIPVIYVAGILLFFNDFKWNVFDWHPATIIILLVFLYCYIKELRENER